ncbi:MAG: acyl-CoA dehydrogenase family protein [Solirubrobacteraceae bacterium]
MNFDFNDEQRAIKEAAREMLASRYPLAEVRRLAEDERGFTDEQWAQLVELGWPGIFVSEELGGQGLGILELVILQEELGYALAPTPFFSNVCAGLVLQGAGDDGQRERWLRPLAAGEQRGTLAVQDEDGGDWLDETSLTAEDSKLTGTKIAVPDAASADFLIVGERDHPYLVDAGADGLTITPTPGIDPTRKLYRVRLEGVEGEPLTGTGPEVARALDAIPTALAAESTGVAQRAMEMAVEYAKERKQFDRPIGAYQAVSHRCADMLLEVEGARSTTYYAAWALDHEPESGALAASMAKAYASEAGWRVTASALQVHGGIGFTWEHDLHFFLKRAEANAHAFGEPRGHRARVAQLTGL